ncbi:hypothetical protein GGF32_004968 [Allomyces javanicus]|nr:hypothetical protein GGF32_004968 [Allomyces javanicus]
MIRMPHIQVQGGAFRAILKQFLQDVERNGANMIQTALCNRSKDGKGKSKSEQFRFPVTIEVAADIDPKVEIVLSTCLARIEARWVDATIRKAWKPPAPRYI